MLSDKLALRMNSRAAPQSVTGAEIEASPRRFFKWQMFFVMAILAFWEQFPFSLLNFPLAFGYQLFAGIIFFGFIFYVIRLFGGSISLSAWDGVAIVLFLSCFATSFYYSCFVVPQPLAGWLPAVYTISPLLTGCVLKSFGTRLADVENALYASGLWASLLVTVDVTLHLHILDFYGRTSIFSDNRIVFFKLESAFAFGIALIRLFYAQGVGKVTWQLVAVALIGFNIFVLSESRLVILAILLAAVPIWAFVLRGPRKPVITLLAPLIAVPVIAFTASHYLSNFENYDQYMTQDVSAHFRSLEKSYFAKAFARTHGLGFGFMSGNEQYHNVLTFGTYEAGYLVGTGNYGMGLVDIGLVSALYQFGYVGFALILAMTAACVVTMTRSIRYGLRFATTAATGWIMLMLMFSPISMNYFTLFYSAHAGALLWFMASSVESERRALAVPANAPEADGVMST